MKLAGINPILAAGSAASSPAGGAATVQPKTGAGTSARAIGNQILDRENRKASNELIRAQIASINTKTALEAFGIPAARLHSLGPAALLSLHDGVTSSAKSAERGKPLIDLTDYFKGVQDRMAKSKAKRSAQSAARTAKKGKKGKGGKSTKSNPSEINIGKSNSGINYYKNNSPAANF